MTSSGADPATLTKKSDREVTPSPERKSSYGPLSNEQYSSRMTHSGKVLETSVPLEGGGAYTLRWAYASQRGYYPDQPNKARARPRPAAARHG